MRPLSLQQTHQTITGTDRRRHAISHRHALSLSLSASPLLSLNVQECRCESTFWVASLRVSLLAAVAAVVAGGEESAGEES